MYQLYGANGAGRGEGENRIKLKLELFWRDGRYYYFLRLVIEIGRSDAPAARSCHTYTVCHG